VRGAIVGISRMRRDAAPPSDPARQGEQDTPVPAKADRSVAPRRPRTALSPASSQSVRSGWIPRSFGRKRRQPAPAQFPPPAAAGPAPFTPEAYLEFSPATCAVLNMRAEDCDPELLRLTWSMLDLYIAETPDVTLNQARAVFAALWEHLAGRVGQIATDTAPEAAPDQALATAPEAAPDEPFAPEVASDEVPATATDAPPNQAPATATDAPPNRAPVTATDAAPNEAPANATDGTPDEAPATAREATPDEVLATAINAAPEAPPALPDVPPKSGSARLPESAAAAAAEAMPDSTVLSKRPLRGDRSTRQNHRRRVRRRPLIGRDLRNGWQALPRRHKSYAARASPS